MSTQSSIKWNEICFRKIIENVLHLAIKTNVFDWLTANILHAWNCSSMTNKYSDVHVVCRTIPLGLNWTLFILDSRETYLASYKNIAVVVLVPCSKPVKKRGGVTSVFFQCLNTVTWTKLFGSVLKSDFYDHHMIIKYYFCSSKCWFSHDNHMISIQWPMIVSAFIA